MSGKQNKWEMMTNEKQMEVAWMHCTRNNYVFQCPGGGFNPIV